MKIAVLADIHANSAALDRVLDDIRKEGIEQLIVLGDIVGYYYEPRAVVEALSAFECTSILGNHDRMALNAREDGDAVDQYRARYGSGLDAVMDQFGPEQWDWLASLPERRRIDLGGRSILLAHGASFDPDAYIYPDASQDQLARLGREGEFDQVWLGHTHYPFMRAGPPVVLNPGSVGQPRDIGGLASWAIYHVETGATAFRRTEFPTAELIDHCRRIDHARANLGKVLSRRRLGVAA